MTWRTSPNGWSRSTRRSARDCPHFSAPEHPARTSYVTLGELERVGALTIRPRDATPREGDVLLRTLGRPPTVATGTSADDTGVAQVVEIDETRLDAHFVATFLRADVGSAAGGQYAGCGQPRRPAALPHPAHAPGRAAPVRRRVPPPAGAGRRAESAGGRQRESDRADHSRPDHRRSGAGLRSE